MWNRRPAGHRNFRVIHRQMSKSRALAYIRTKYGTVEHYLLTEAGMTDADLASLRANLLE